MNSAEMFQKAFVKAIEFEKVLPHNHLLFQLTYESCFNKALNSKRSFCEQASGMLARKAIADFKKRGEEFFSFEEFCKLRRVTTEREKRHSFGSLIDSWSVFAGQEHGEIPRKPPAGGTR